MIGHRVLPLPLALARVCTPPGVTTATTTANCRIGSRRTSSCISFLLASSPQTNGIQGTNCECPHLSPSFSASPSHLHVHAHARAQRERARDRAKVRRLFLYLFSFTLHINLSPLPTPSQLVYPYRVVPPLIDEQM